MWSINRGLLVTGRGMCALHRHNLFSSTILKYHEMVGLFRAVFSGGKKGHLLRAHRHQAPPPGPTTTTSPHHQAPCTTNPHHQAPPPPPGPMHHQAPRTTSPHHQAPRTTSPHHQAPPPPPTSPHHQPPPPAPTTSRKTGTRASYLIDAN